MRLLVTGGTGFLGSRVVPFAVAQGHDVYALVRSPAAAEAIRALGGHPVAGDLDQQDSVVTAFCSIRADALLNLASLGFGHAPTIVRAAEVAGLSRAVFISTTAIFTTLEARSKATRVAAEDAIRASTLEWTILRPTMIYGSPADRNMWRLLQMLRRWPVVPIPADGERLQQPVHVDDVAAATVAAIERPATAGRAYDLAGPEPLSFRQVVRYAAAALDRRPIAVPMPMRAAIAGLRVYGRLSANPGIKAEQIQRLGEDKVFDIEPARRDLDYCPRPFEVGIRAEADMRS